MINQNGLNRYGAWQGASTAPQSYGSPMDSNAMNGDCNSNRLPQLMDERYQMACLEVEKEVAKKLRKDAVGLQTYEMKLRIQESERERKKAQCEELNLVNGRVQVATRNLRSEAIPMVISNIREPVLDVLRRLADDADEAYCIGFSIGGEGRSVFLDEAKAGSGAYLLRKFAAEGAIFKADAIARQKNYACQLLSYLLSQKPKAYWVAEDEGWTEFPDRGWEYVEEGELTWTKVRRLCR